MLPSVEMPSVEMPSVEMPSVEMSSVEMPSVEMPSVEMPSVGNTADFLLVTEQHTREAARLARSTETGGSGGG